MGRATGDIVVPFRAVGQLPVQPVEALALRLVAQSITGERIRRRLRSGGINDHVYYRCANNNPGADHPRIRWRAADLEMAVIDDLASLRLPSQEHVDWFRTALSAAFADTDEYRRHQAATLKRRRSELAGMQDRLLNAYLTGTVEEAVYRAKTEELRSEIRTAEEALERIGDHDPARTATALAAFDFSQRAAELFRGSNNAVRREILDAVYLNRLLTDVTLVTTKRKPFDVLAERPILKKSRSDWTRLELFVRSTTRLPKRVVEAGAGRHAGQAAERVVAVGGGVDLGCTLVDAVAAEAERSGSVAVAVLHVSRSRLLILSDCHHAVSKRNASSTPSNPAT